MARKAERRRWAISEQSGPFSGELGQATGARNAPTSHRQNASNLGPRRNRANAVNNWGSPPSTFDQTQPSKKGKHMKPNRLLLAFLMSLTLWLHSAQATMCICSYIPFCVGSQKIATYRTSERKMIVGGDPKIEFNGDVVCIGNPPVPATPTEKTCRRAVELSLNFQVDLGLKFGAPEWGSIGLSASPGVKRSDECNASIKSWCSCCICVCYIPVTTTTAYGSCDADCISLNPLGWFARWPCSKEIVDEAVKYGLVSCTSSWDEDNDGKDDCWKKVPTPCRTSCNSGS